MQTLEKDDTLVVSLQPGEEILASLLDIAKTHGITAGSLSGLGSVSEADLAFFDPDKGQYLPRTFREPMEIGNMVGNFSLLEGKNHVHVHVSLSGRELIAFTGHLSRGVVGTACEIYIRKLSAEVRRVKNSAKGFDPLELM